MIKIFNRLKYAYFVTKAKEYMNKGNYEKALIEINKIKFGNDLYRYVLKGSVNYYLKNYDEALSNFDKSFKYIDISIYNSDEKKYIKSYIFYIEAIIFKEKKEKDKSLNSLKKYNTEKSFDIENIRQYLLEDFLLK